MDVGDGGHDSAGLGGTALPAGTYGDTQIFPDCEEDVIHGYVFFYQLDSPVSPLVGYDNARLFQFIGGFSEKRVFDGKLLAHRTDGMDSLVVGKVFDEQESIFSGRGDFEHI